MAAHGITFDFKHVDSSTMHQSPEELKAELQVMRVEAASVRPSEFSLRRRMHSRGGVPRLWSCSMLAEWPKYLGNLGIRDSVRAPVFCGEGLRAMFHVKLPGVSCSMVA